MASQTNESFAESAAAHLERGEPGVPCSRGTAEDIRRQAAELQQWAESKSCLISLDFLAIDRKAEGAEHVVVYKADQNCVWKITHPGTFGSVHTLLGLQRTATPYFYLRRILLTNEIFQSEIELIGVTSGAHPSIIISQPYAHPASLEDPLPSREEIGSFMRSLGFEPIDETALNWIRKEDRIRVSDAKPDNFIKTQGGPTPIDLVVGFDDLESN